MVGRSVGWSVGRSVNIFLKSGKKLHTHAPIGALVYLSIQLSVLCSMPHKETSLYAPHQPAVSNFRREAAYEDIFVPQYMPVLAP